LKKRSKKLCFLEGRVVESVAHKYQSFQEFYPFYISEHQNLTSRRLHVIGTGLVLCCALAGLLFDIGYGFAWAGHFFFEKNRPATFKYPLFSLLGDFRLFFEVATGKRAF
jgi:hypothetical protein